MGPSKTCQELHGGQHQLFRRLLQHSDAGSPRSESKGSSSFAVSMRSDAAQMALYAELLLHVGRSQMASYVRREKSACKTRATRRSELGYPTVVAFFGSSPRTHQGTARRAATLPGSPEQPVLEFALDLRRRPFRKKTFTYVRTYARTAYAVQEPQYTVASSRLVDYQGAMADCTDASELFDYCRT